MFFFLLSHWNRSSSRMVPTRNWARVARTFSAMISKEDERNNGYVAPIDGLLVQLLAGLALLHMAGHLSLAHLTPYFVPFFFFVLTKCCAIPNCHVSAVPDLACSENQAARGQPYTYDSFENFYAKQRVVAPALRSPCHCHCTTCSRFSLTTLVRTQLAPL